MKMENSWPFPQSPVALQVLGLSFQWPPSSQPHPAQRGQPMWPCQESQGKGAQCGHRDCLCLPSVLTATLCPVLGPNLLSRRAAAATTSVTARGRGLRGLCFLGCCYAGPATGSSEIGLWSGVGLVLGSQGRPPQPGLLLQSGRAKLEPPAFQFRGPK